MLVPFLRDSAIYTFPAIISRGLSFFLIPVYTQVLAPSDFGALDMLLIFGNLVNLTVALEVSQGVARYAPAEKEARAKTLYASSALWFTVFCYALFLVLSMYYAPVLSVWIIGRAGFDAVVRIGMVYITINGIFYLVQNQFRWELRSAQYATVSLLVAVVTAAFAVSLTYFLHWGLKGFLYGLIAGPLVGCLYGLYHLRDLFRFCFSSGHLKDLLAFSAPLVPSGIAVFITIYIDRFMINHFMTLNDVGLYGVGMRIASIVGFCLVGFRGALTPLIYKHYKETNTPWQLERIFRYFLAFALTVFAGVSVFSPEIMAIMTTPTYYAAAPVIIYLVPGILLSNMYIFAPGIAIAKKNMLTLWINVGGALANTILNYLFIPVFGISGAAGATLLGYMGVFGAHMFFSQRLYPVPHDWRRIAVAAGGITCLTIAGLHISWPSIVGIPLKAAIVCLGGVYLVTLGIVPKNEIQDALFFCRQRFIKP